MSNPTPGGPSPSNPATPAEATPSKPAKPRSPVERAIVWGLIAVLLIVVGLEWRSKKNFETSQELVRAALQASDAGPKSQPFHLKDVDALLVGNPSITEEKEVVTVQRGRQQSKTYTWKSIFKTYSFMLSADFDDGAVIDIVDPEEELVNRKTDQQRLIDARANARATEGQGGGGGFGALRGARGGAPSNESKPEPEAKPEGENKPEAAPAEPAPAEPAPAEPAPAEPAPAEAAPAEPAPAEAAPAEPAPTEPAPAEPAPAEPAPAEPAPAEPAPAEPAPATPQ